MSVWKIHPSGLTFTWFLEANRCAAYFIKLNFWGVLCIGTVIPYVTINLLIPDTWLTMFLKTNKYK